MSPRLALRRLVVNADDAGIDVARNVGILEAHERGVVRSATVLAMGRGFEDFVRRARAAPGLGVGVHLNLSVCCPPASAEGVPGAFAEKHALWARLEQRALDQALLRRELEAQLRRVVDAGLAPTHVDGHNHIHVFPCVAEALDELEAEFPFVARRRCPRSYEFGATGAQAAQPPASPTSAESSAARVKSARLAALAGLRRPNAGPSQFAGFALEGCFELARLLQVLEACPGEALELMTHPGRCVAGGAVPFSREPAREAELRVLCDPRLRAWLAERDVALVHWGAFDGAPRSAP